MCRGVGEAEELEERSRVVCLVGLPREVDGSGSSGVCCGVAWSLKPSKVGAVTGAPGGERSNSLIPMAWLRRSIGLGGGLGVSPEEL